MKNKWLDNLGLILLIIGIGLLILKGIIPETIDADGILREGFYLLPFGFGLILLGLIILISRIILNRKNKR